MHPASASDQQSNRKQTNTPGPGQRRTGFKKNQPQRKYSEPKSSLQIKYTRQKKAPVGRLYQSRQSIRLATITLAELVHPASSIHELLLTSVKGMARRTYFHVQLFTQGRLGLKGIAAATGNLYLCVIRMNVSFHFHLRPFRVQAALYIKDTLFRTSRIFRRNLHENKNLYKRMKRYYNRKSKGCYKQ